MTPPTSQRNRPEGTAMNGAKLRERLSKGETITMFNPHHVSPGLSARLAVSMIETLEAIGNIDELAAVEGIDVFFIGPGDLSQNMGYPPAPAFGQPRPQAVIDKVGFAVDKIRAAGKIAGTLVTADELP